MRRVVGVLIGVVAGLGTASAEKLPTLGVDVALPAGFTVVQMPGTKPMDSLQSSDPKLGITVLLAENFNCVGYLVDQSRESGATVERSPAYLPPGRESFAVIRTGHALACSSRTNNQAILFEITDDYVAHADVVADVINRVLVAYGNASPYDPLELASKKRIDLSSPLLAQWVASNDTGHWRTRFGRLGTTGDVYVDWDPKVGETNCFAMIGIAQRLQYLPKTTWQYAKFDENSDPATCMETPYGPRRITMHMSNQTSLEEITALLTAITTAYDAAEQAYDPVPVAGETPAPPPAPAAHHTSKFTMGYFSVGYDRINKEPASQTAANTGALFRGGLVHTRGRTFTMKADLMYGTVLSETPPYSEYDMQLSAGGYLRGETIDLGVLLGAGRNRMNMASPEDPFVFDARMYAGATAVLRFHSGGASFETNFEYTTESERRLEVLLGYASSSIDMFVKGFAIGYRRVNYGDAGVSSGASLWLVFF